MAKKTIVAILLFLCVTLHAVAQERFSRGFSNDSFVPKGQWVTGVSVGFSQSNQNNYQFFILEGINGDTYSFKVTPMFCFIFKDDLGVGGKFGYERSRIKVDEANLVLDSNTNVDFESLYSINQEYSATGIFRNYIGMGRSKRFGFFNEVQLGFGIGESKLTDGSGDGFTGTFERSYNINVGLMPGVVMFLNNYSAIEVSIGVLGFKYSHTKQTNDQIYIAKRDSKNANFKINLFSVSFGVSFYL